ncbi:hypothetical protein [Parashewanella tropica]|uniref:hypothetical protein n=1 Tax=Parashewanella tropica TaxID=2547970 RepID=UPI001059745A|nr:hypothetical protein [Parashewanella tropica]
MKLLLLAAVISSTALAEPTIHSFENWRVIGSEQAQIATPSSPTRAKMFFGCTNGTDCSLSFVDTTKPCIDGHQQTMLLDFQVMDSKLPNLLGLNSTCKNDSWIDKEQSDIENFVYYSFYYDILNNPYSAQLNVIYSNRTTFASYPLKGLSKAVHSVIKPASNYSLW